jgi:hypothetical protein
MATPAICTRCGHEHRYPATKGARIRNMHCVRCGGLGTLARGGRNPSTAARAARRARGARPAGPRLHYALGDGIVATVASAVEKVEHAFPPGTSRRRVER